MDGSRIEDIFKQFGKIIRLAEIGAAAASGVKEHAVAMHSQFTQNAAGADDFAGLQIYIVPAQQKINPVVGALDRVQGLSKTSLESYLRTLAAELSLNANSNAATILDELADRMNAVSYAIAPSGKFWSYFREQLAFDGFPQADPPELSDALITTTIL